MTDRIPLDQMNSDQLDALYERVAKAEQEADAAVAAAAQLTTLVGKRSERAERAAEKQRRRADIAETELHILRTGLRANGADPTQIQNLWAQIRLRNRQWRNEKQRAAQAEAALARVQALAAEHPVSIDTALIRTALDGTQQPATEQPNTCTATIPDAFGSAALHRCTAPAGHYDESDQPVLTGNDRIPGGWHTDGEGHVWSDRADAATPHSAQPDDAH